MYVLYMKNFKGRKFLAIHIMCGTFESEASCPTQAVFCFSMQLFHDKAFAVFIGPQKQQNFSAMKDFMYMVYVDTLHT